VSHLIATEPARARALEQQRERTRQADADLGRERPSRLWALIEALAYAGAYIDPSGILAIQRLRQAQEEAEERDDLR
jgi:hypothetical protein